MIQMTNYERLNNTPIVFCSRRLVRDALNDGQSKITKLNQVSVGILGSTGAYTIILIRLSVPGLAKKFPLTPMFNAFPKNEDIQLDIILHQFDSRSVHILFTRTETRIRDVWTNRLTVCSRQRARHQHHTKCHHHVPQTFAYWIKDDLSTRTRSNKPLRNRDSSIALVLHGTPRRLWLQITTRCTVQRNTMRTRTCTTIH